MDCCLLCYAADSPPPPAAAATDSAWLLPPDPLFVSKRVAEGSLAVDAFLLLPSWRGPSRMTSSERQVLVVLGQ